MRKPILAVLHPGSLWKLLENAGVPCFRPEDKESIRGQLLSILNDFRVGKPLKVPKGLTDLHQYSRIFTAQRLAESLHSLIK